MNVATPPDPLPTTSTIVAGHHGTLQLVSVSADGPILWGEPRTGTQSSPVNSLGRILVADTRAVSPPEKVVRRAVGSATHRSSL